MLAAVLALVAGCDGSAGRPAAPSGSGVVERVVDGDTVDLRDGRTVRLVQIDAPEMGRECGADAARDALVRLAPPGSSVRLAADPSLDQTDRFGRLLRYLIRGGVNLNLELVREGAVAPYFYTGDEGRLADRLLAAARAARSARSGLWGACPGTPLEPTRNVDPGPGG
jgi:endonuclease YncB( thermonuclease family)